MECEIKVGDVLQKIAEIESGTVNTCVTSHLIGVYETTTTTDKLV